MAIHRGASKRRKPKTSFEKEISFVMRPKDKIQRRV